MNELLLQIVKGIVNNPDEVSIEERESVDFPGLTILEITVSNEDKGILIGRKGRTINAIRDLMTISAIRNEKRIKVLVKDDRKPRETQPSDQKSAQETPKKSKPAPKPPKVEEEVIDKNNMKEEEPTMTDDEAHNLLSDDEL